MRLEFGVAVNAIAGLLQALFCLSDLALDVGDPILAGIVAVGSPDGHVHRGRSVHLSPTLVRMVVVPATMALMGRANWWLPRWLDRRLPHVNVEGAEAIPEHEPALAG